MRYKHHQPLNEAAQETKFTIDMSDSPTLVVVIVLQGKTHTHRTHLMSHLSHPCSGMNLEILLYLAEKTKM